MGVCLLSQYVTEAGGKVKKKKKSNHKQTGEFLNITVVVLICGFVYICIVLYLLYFVTRCGTIIARLIRNYFVNGNSK